jgi:hypothetical protein
MAIRLIIRRRGAGAGEAPAAQTFDGPIISIGSDPGAGLRLEDRTVAPEQAIIIGGDEEPPLFINRAEGTLLNGEQLAREARRPLSDGDAILIGPYVISVEAGNGFRPGAEASAQAEESPAPDTRETPAFTEESEATSTTQPTSFAAILDSLRTEEDTFYFQVETATAGRRRVPVEGNGMLLGWDASGQNVVCGETAAAVPTVRALARKDWSGVVLHPEGAAEAFVNGEPVEAPRRLRNGDRVTLRPAPGTASQDPARNFFIFYEPTSLVVLDSLLPAQQLPPPVTAPPPTQEVAGAGALVPTAAAPPAARERPRDSLLARRFLRYYTVGEFIFMVCATLAGAFVIFLILEYS